MFAACESLASGYPCSPAALTDVTVTGGFWLPRFETNRLATLSADFAKCEETRIPNFTNAAARAKGTFKGIPYDDSDVYKVIEGAAYVLATHPDASLKARFDRLIGWIAGAQEPDGYLYTARTLGFNYGEKDGKTDYGMMGPVRWSNCRSSHELYNLGHLYEAAVAWLEATGERTLLAVAEKSADLVGRTFGPGEAQLKHVPGHEEIELALCKLYGATGEKRYLELARHFIARRGYGVKSRDGKVFAPDGSLVDAGSAPEAYCQNHQPVADQREAVGHAVRATYLYCGMADVAALAGDAGCAKALDALWENVVSKKLHLNGSVGARRKGEAFGADYELPNETAYLETCAGIGNALWNERMFLLHGDAKYVDVLERALYNGILSGVSLCGDEFFYPNPLASKGGSRRSKWFRTSCCPVNVVRFIAQVAQFAYATRGDAAYVNLFVESDATLRLGCGDVRVSQKTDYPWSGAVRLAVTPPDDGARFALNVRVPGWCAGRPVPSDLYEQTVPGTAADFTARVNGEAVNFEPVKGYCVIERRWKGGDVVEIAMNMPVRRIRAHEKVGADKGRLAVERGPILYCAEGVDNGGKAFDAAIPADATFAESKLAIGDQEFLALRSSNGVTLVPYCIWGNRQPGNDMQTWFPAAAAAAASALAGSDPRVRFRGVMSPGRDMTEDDFKTLESWGATLLRYQMVRNWHGVNANQDLDEYDRWLEGRLDHFDRFVLPMAARHGLKVVLDLHVPPGGRDAGAEANMFYDEKYASHFVGLWRRIARRFRGREGIYGYDLINEPSQKRAAAPGLDFWNLQRRAAEAVREEDPAATIVMESNEWDAPATFASLKPLALSNVVYQVHMYEPFAYTHQRVLGTRPWTVGWPNAEKGWDRAFLEKTLKPVRDFQLKHGARIYGGESSAVCWAPDAWRYLRDCISLFEEYGWDWTYHAFREWPGWSPEHEGENDKTFRLSQDNPRKRALLDGFRR